LRQALLQQVAVPCHWPSPGLLGWVGLLEACARSKDAAAAERGLSDAAAALGLLAATTSSPGSASSGEALQAALRAVATAEPLLLGAAAAAFSSGEGYGSPGPALLAAAQAALLASGDEAVSARPLSLFGFSGSQS
jgi:hypothetical protein